MYRGDRIQSPGNLLIGDYLVSGNGVFSCILQPDDNLVIYANTTSGQVALWASGKNRPDDPQPCFTAIQADGNIVQYWGTPDNPGAPFWDAFNGNPPGPGNYTLVMQGDGNLVLYDGKGGSPWGSNTHQSRVTYPRSITFERGGITDHQFQPNEGTGYEFYAANAGQSDLIGLRIGIDYDQEQFSNAGITVDVPTGPSGMPELTVASLPAGTSSLVSFTLLSSGHATPGNYNFSLKLVEAALDGALSPFLAVDAGQGFELVPDKSSLGRSKASLGDIPDIDILVASVGKLTTHQLEGRCESEDSSGFVFTVTNISKLMKYTNVKLYLFFDYTDLNMTVNGQTQGLPLMLPIPDLLPFIPSDVNLDIVTNVGTVSKENCKSTTPGNYSIIVTATFDAQPLIPSSPSKGTPIAGGVQIFTVVED